jgi:hypothetical protein
MSEPDVVALLDFYLKHYSRGQFAEVKNCVLSRARDEIVALRTTVERQKFVLSKGHAETRAAALEEAARVCEEPYTTGSTAAAAIRRLKEKL